MSEETGSNETSTQPDATPGDAGWYPDPHSRKWAQNERFWNGTEWTGQTRVSPELASAAAKQAVGQARSRIEQEDLAGKAKKLRDSASQVAAETRARLEEGGLQEAASDAGRRIGGRKKVIGAGVGLLLVVALILSALGGPGSAGLEDRLRSGAETLAKEQTAKRDDFSIWSGYDAKDCRETGGKVLDESSGSYTSEYRCLVKVGDPNLQDSPPTWREVCFPDTDVKSDVDLLLSWQNC